MLLILQGFLIPRYGNIKKVGLLTQSTGQWRRCVTLSKHRRMNDELDFAEEALAGVPLRKIIRPD